MHYCFGTSQGIRLWTISGDFFKVQSHKTTLKRVKNSNFSYVFLIYWLLHLALMGVLSKSWLSIVLKYILLFDLGIFSKLFIGCSINCPF